MCKLRRRECHAVPPSAASPDAFRTKRVTTTWGTSLTTTASDLETVFDWLGRPLFLCDRVASTNCDTPLVEWVYDSKGALASTTTTYAPEGTSRTIKLTDAYQRGRLAYVRHQAGMTLFEYDALGRVKMRVEYDGNTAGKTLSSLLGSKMRVTELTYNATGALEYERLPSGRALSRLYGNDATRPYEIYIRVDPNGVNTYNRVAGDISWGASGELRGWRWGQSGTLDAWHDIERDWLGRITAIKDRGAGTLRASLAYGYDEDGDVTSLTDSGTLRSIQMTGPLTGATRALTYPTGAFSDQMQSWVDPADGTHALTFTSLGQRFTEAAGGKTYGYTSTGERMTARTFSVSPRPIAVRWYRDVAGAHVTDIDYLYDGTNEVTSLDYTPDDQLRSATTAAGVWGYRSDETATRWFKSLGNKRAKYAHDPGGDLVELTTTVAGTVTSRDEYVWLAGMPIAVTHTDSTYPTPRTWWLSTDALGTPRRILDSTTSLTQVSRLALDPWGRASCVPSATYAIACPYAGVRDGGQTDERNGLAAGLPVLPFRLPGQLVDEETGLNHNRWRMYSPDLGQYLSPDPEHRTTAWAHPGPQAYAYANGNPLRFTDPTGERPGAAYSNAEAAARAALEDVIAISRTRSQEYSGLIYQWGDESTCSYTDAVTWGGAAASPGPETLFNETIYGFGNSLRRDIGCGSVRPKVLAWYHTHGDFTGEWYKFSRQDLALSIQGVDGKSVDAYLGTPSGSFLYYRPGSMPTRLQPDLRGGMTPPSSPPPGYWGP